MPAQKAVCPNLKITAAQRQEGLFDSPFSGSPPLCRYPIKSVILEKGGPQGSGIFHVLAVVVIYTVILDLFQDLLRF